MTRCQGHSTGNHPLFREHGTCPTTNWNDSPFSSDYVGMASSCLLSPQDPQRFVIGAPMAVHGCCILGRVNIQTAVASPNWTRSDSKNTFMQPSKRASNPQIPLPIHSNQEKPAARLSLESSRKTPGQRCGLSDWTLASSAQFGCVLLWHTWHLRPRGILNGQSVYVLL